MRRVSEQFYGSDDNDAGPSPEDNDEAGSSLEDNVMANELGVRTSLHILTKNIHISQAFTDREFSPEC